MTNPANTIPEAQQHLHTPEEHAVDTASVHSAPAAAAAAAPTRTVLIPVEASLQSTATVRWAKRHFLRASDRVVLVNVRPYQQIYFADLGADLLVAVNRMEAAARDNSHDLIRVYAKYITDANAEDTPSVVPQEITGYAIRGDPRADIVRKAREVAADAIVIGSRGLGALKRTLLGSVSDYVAHHATVPVVIVRTSPDEEHDHATAHAKLEFAASPLKGAIQSGGAETAQQSL
ncbi:hypothetical protein H9P43_008771 [Blastocladiella emersonii ATCC 22665]|nr:hypothetical protein H9P43_008771 [Blastocladiella emersonii ATCC 22665]